MRKTTTASAGVLMVLVLAGCSQGTSDASRSADPAPTAPSQARTSPPQPLLPSNLASIPSAASGDVDDDTGQTIAPQPVPTWNEQTEHQANAAAEAAMTAFARPFLDYQTWWTKLSPLLTVQAQQDYADVDPANIPAHGVVGDARVTTRPSSYVVDVVVPTDIGPYTVVITRPDASAPWLIASLTPPEGVK